MPIIQFSHANGFPANSYSVLFNQFKDYKISSINILGENTSVDKIDWFDLSNEVLDSAKTHGEKVIGIGHSFGGILTILAAAKNPSLFQNIILLDPPLFAPLKNKLIKLLRIMKLEDKFLPYGKSKWRRDKFNSKSEALSLFKENMLFKDFHPEVLSDYIKYGLIENELGAELTIPVDKELAIFHNSLTSYPESIYKLSGTMIYAVKKPIVYKSDLRWIKKKLTKFKIIPFPGTHFFPLIHPHSTALMIKRFI